MGGTCKLHKERPQPDGGFDGGPWCCPHPMMKVFNFHEKRLLKSLSCLVLSDKSVHEICSVFGEVFCCQCTAPCHICLINSALLFGQAHVMFILLVFSVHSNNSRSISRVSYSHILQFCSCSHKWPCPVIITSLLSHSLTYHCHPPFACFQPAEAFTVNHCRAEAGSACHLDATFPLWSNLIFFAAMNII